ncbi:MULTISPECIES: heavy-metal-associated domain-containing protein [Thermotoga]|uniref:Heavy metal binding protein n=1 Tax=Thermotoga neapolitana (strain ATCC 49049 / DSM 4359 / NBRC 107923 / NS-E) TaxID=309803 RepID=B9KBC1_THENN|nr:MULTISPECIES: heavy-metal-associated domain-containing protein [Thermotoga]MDK2786116.1 copper chaperone [Thermotoga sp.]ACM22317.1 Heavy metal binding protein [Thermotoga neapolitana DSM 4359]AJG40279.1 copper resistance protein CopZ [Thermotoga sp. RQ7]KFZ22438.1 Heavy metal binding protein [Thermotoga neapolitana LA10]MDK2949937.1 copper chaperone [Thermotoga sp.]
MRRLNYFMLKGAKTEEDYKKVKSAIEKLDGVFKVDYEMAAEVVGVDYDDETISKEQIKAVVDSLGYTLIV